MNERIKQLADEARIKPMGSSWAYRLADEFEEEFARLIVKECLSQVDKIRDGLEADGEDQQALGADWAGLAIARHFGVEE